MLIKQRHILNVLCLGILAGVMIAMGGFAYCACLAYTNVGPGKVLGSLVFSVGLVGVCSLGLYLYTGKIGYLFQNGKSCLLDLLIGYIGNVIGALGIGALVSAIPSIRDGAVGTSLTSIATSRALFVNEGEPFYSALILSFLCGILVFIAVDIYKKKPGVIGLVGLILGVTAFVVTGMEHTIANMFYFSAAGAWNVGCFLNIVITTIGNSLGAIFFERLLHFGTISFESHRNQA